MTVSCGLAPLSTIKVSAGKQTHSLSLSLPQTQTHRHKRSIYQYQQSRYDFIIDGKQRCQLSGILFHFEMQTEENLGSRLGLRSRFLGEYFGGAGKRREQFGSEAPLTNFSVQLSTTALQDCVPIQTVWTNLSRLCWLHSL